MLIARCKALPTSQRDEGDENGERPEALCWPRVPRERSRRIGGSMAAVSLIYRVSAIVDALRTQ